MDYKLSICIPTYNRSKYLKELLDDIVNYKNIFFEVVISDNYSSDDTYSLVKEYSYKYGFIRYIRPLKQLKPELNFRFVAENAKSEFVWIFGDDDRFESYTLDYIYNYIYKKPDILILNFSVWDRDLVRNIKNSFYEYKKDLFLNSHNEVWKKFGLSLGYISEIVFRKDILFKLPLVEYEKYLDYGFPFAYAIYYGIINEKNMIYLSLPLFKNRSGNSGNYNWYKYFVEGPSLIYNDLIKNGYSKYLLKYVIRKDFKRYVLKKILVDKRDNILNSSNKKTLLKSYRNDLFLSIIVLFIFLIPNFVIKFIYIIKKNLVNILKKNGKKENFN